MNTRCYCLSCRYEMQKADEDPCYRCYRGSEYVYYLYDVKEYDNCPQNKDGGHDELKPCPFCGENILVTHNTYSDIFEFSCPNCKAHIHFGYGSSTVHYGGIIRAETEAKRSWNRRVGR